MENASLNLDTFIDNLINEKGLDYLEGETLIQLKKDLLERVEDRINGVILENMPPEYLEEFEKMIDGDMSDEEMQKYCSEKITNLPELIAEALVSFRQIYING